MSEYFNNKEDKKENLRKLINMLHQGEDVDKVRRIFKEKFGNVTGKEIAEAEQALIDSGVTVEEIKSLCHVHTSIFKDSIEGAGNDYNKNEVNSVHPLELLALENKEIESIVTQLEKTSITETTKIEELLKRLQGIESHYLKKETALFPLLEKRGIMSPTRVMWDIDNDIRKSIKKAINDIKNNSLTEETCGSLISEIREMIFKEENILFSMAREEFTEREWKELSIGCLEIGYIINVPQIPYKIQDDDNDYLDEEELTGEVKLPTGSFTTEELHNLFSTLPFDITFVDKNNKVRFFSQSKDRIFARTTAIIGREVSNCHPNASVHIVEKIVEDLRSGKKDNEDFWLKIGNMYVYIRYFAIRNDKKEYLGVIEITQDIKHIQDITGEKRLVE